MNYTVWPVADKRWYCSKNNNNLEHSDDNKGKEVTATKVRLWILKGWQGCGLEGKQGKGLWAGPVSFLDGGCSLGNYFLCVHLCFLFIYCIS